MIIIPAIDIKDGKVVRLTQGKFDQVTEYSDDPATVARHWVNAGAERMHVIDLDGAKEGKIVNLESIRSIAKEIDIPIEMGGGVRTEKDVQSLLDAGVSYVILGTKVLDDFLFLESLVKKFGDKIIVSLDCSEGKIADQGWTNVTDVEVIRFAKELEQIGVQCIVYTDIARDGMLTGPNFEGINKLLDAVNIPIIASGGISNIEDIKELVKLESKGVFAAITGKAIYEGRLIFEEAVKASSATGE